jgi:hypothetical protein
VLRQVPPLFVLLLVLFAPTCSVSLLAVAGANASQVSPGVAIDAEDRVMEPGEPTSISVVFQNFTRGIDSFNATVSSNDSDVVRVESVRIRGQPTHVRRREGRGGGSLSINATKLGRPGPRTTLAWVNVRGGETGNATVSVTLESSTGRDGKRYDQIEGDSVSLRVNSSAGDPGEHTDRDSTTTYVWLFGASVALSTILTGVGWALFRRVSD